MKKVLQSQGQALQNVSQIDDDVGTSYGFI